MQRISQTEAEARRSEAVCRPRRGRVPAPAWGDVVANKKYAKHDEHDSNDREHSEENKRVNKRVIHIGAGAVRIAGSRQTPRALRLVVRLGRVGQVVRAARAVSARQQRRHRYSVSLHIQLGSRWYAVQYGSQKPVALHLPSRPHGVPAGSFSVAGASGKLYGRHVPLARDSSADTGTPSRCTCNSAAGSTPCSTARKSLWRCTCRADHTACRPAASRLVQDSARSSRCSSPAECRTTWTPSGMRCQTRKICSRSRSSHR